MLSFSENRDEHPLTVQHDSKLEEATQKQKTWQGMVASPESPAHVAKVWPAADGWECPSPTGNQGLWVYILKHPRRRLENDQASFRMQTAHASRRTPLRGLGKGNPLQYSCRENPMDRGAWRATVHGGAKSQTGLKHTYKIQAFYYMISYMDYIISI